MRPRIDLPARALILLSILAVLASCSARGREVVGPGEPATGVSPSRAVFEHDGPIVVGAEIPVDQPLTLEVTLGRQLVAGSQIAVSFPTAVQEESDALWSIPTVDRDAPGSIRLGGSAGDRVEVAEAARADGGAGRVVVRATRLLEAGDTIRIGLTGQAPQIVPHAPFRIVEVDAADNSIAALAPENVALAPVVAAPAVTLLLSIRSDLAAGERADMRLAALDQFGNVDTSYRGRVTFASDLDGCPTEYAFTAEDAGVHTIEGLRPRRAGNARVTARAEFAGGPRDVASNPVHVSASRPEYRRFFGDPHFHTGSDVATLSTPGGDHRGQFVRSEDAFAYLRDVVALDWGASAEHDTGLTKETWQANQTRVDSFNNPGRFVTLLGYEFTPPRRIGHHVVLFEGGPSEKNPLVGASSGRRGGKGAASYVELAQAMRFGKPDAAARVLLVPHVMQPFPNGDTDREEHDLPHAIWDGSGGRPGPNFANDLRRVGEIYSHHNDDFSTGDYRQTQRGRGDAINQPELFELGMSNPWSYQHAWAAGHRVGVIGGSDNHLGTPGLNDFAPTVQHHAGLAVVLASELTREAVFSALYDRRCYATTGPKILLDFSVAGEAMGREVMKQNGTSIAIALDVAGTTTLTAVEVVKLVGDQWTVIRTAPLAADATTATLSFQDTLDGPAIYYLRVTQKDGEMAWSSPVWIGVNYE